MGRKKKKKGNEGFKQENRGGRSKTSEQVISILSFNNYTSSTADTMTCIDIPNSQNYSEA